MNEPLLKRFQVYDTTSVDESREKTGRLMRSHRLSPLDRRATGFRARHHVAPLGEASLHYVAYGPGETLVQPGPLETFYVVLLPQYGRCTVTSAGRRIVTAGENAAVVSPEDSLSMLWQGGAGQLMVKVPSRWFHDRLELLLHKPLTSAVRFELGMDLTRGPGREWASMVRHNVSNIDAGLSLLQHEPILGSIGQGLATALLYAHSHNYSDSLRSDDPSAGERMVRSVVAFVKDSPQVPASVADLVAYARVSERALQRAFRKHLNVSPKQFLLAVRLERVHQVLVDTDPDASMSVGEIAANAGVTHFGRFSQYYRARHGESLADTKRRGRMRA
ncbi:AraC family transcriptional regulator [Amycolatopsis benzoatilytica]|uniref:AraC family transcriptional regulator n=1 Tax=Amycolatopsis benzoatilytica TaxID=346045 RepID=UPI000363089D|nr:helix-turn-helix domain-containing protein [Amycolatopsis benzoatilytica]